MVNQNQKQSKENYISVFCNWSIIMVWIPIMQDEFNKFDFYQKLRSMEPITSKLSRWIFGFKLPHPAGAEFIFDFELPDHIFYQVKHFYCQTDKELFFGVSRKYLYLLFKQMNLIKNDKEKLEFYQRSGYYQKKNQRVSSVHFKYFVQMVEDFYNRAKKENSELSFDDFINQLKEAHMVIIKKYKNWEIKAQLRRSEYLKMSLAITEVRQSQIKLILKEDPFMSEETLENKLSKYGLEGLSLKEKLLFYQLRLHLFSILLDSYKLKQNDQFLLDSQKKKKLENNVLKYEKLVNEEQQKCDKTELQIKQLFKGEWHSV